MDIHLLDKQGFSQREIAKMTGFSRNTVSKLLNYPQLRPKAAPTKPALLNSNLSNLTSKVAMSSTV